LSLSIISLYVGLTVYLVSFLRYLTSSNGVHSQSKLGVIQGRLKWHRSIEHVGLPVSLPL